jgi:DNA topoisomerase-2
MNPDEEEITIKNFINKELIKPENERLIPNVLDGLKPGQRKVFYTCFKKSTRTKFKFLR